jgi:hypothetical protein
MLRIHGFGLGSTRVKTLVAKLKNMLPKNEPPTYCADFEEGLFREEYFFGSEWKDISPQSGPQ